MAYRHIGFQNQLAHPERIVGPLTAKGIEGAARALRSSVGGMRNALRIRNSSGNGHLIKYVVR
jgi:hypothetical protein